MELPWVYRRDLIAQRYHVLPEEIEERSGAESERTAELMALEAEAERDRRRQQRNRQQRTATHRAPRRRH